MVEYKLTTLDVLDIERSFAFFRLNGKSGKAMEFAGSNGEANELGMNASRFANSTLKRT